MANFKTAGGKSEVKGSMSYLYVYFEQLIHGVSITNAEPMQNRILS